MPVDPDADITITAFDWVPDFARGQVRDLRVRWALEEVGLSYRVRYLSQGEQKGSAHRAHHPFGQVPTFEQDGLTLFESGAIVLHIAGRHPALLPEDASARARAIAWMFAALNTIEPPIVDHTIATLFEADKPWSRPRLPAIRARIDERLGDAAARLAGREWFEGDRFTAGDLLMASVLGIVAPAGLLAPYPNLAAFVARATARPACRRALADQLAGFTGRPPPGYAAWQRRTATAAAGEQA